MIDFLNKLGEISASHGMKLGIHPDTGCAVWLWDEIIKVLEATDKDNVGLALDTGHMITAGGTTQEIIELMESYAKRIAYFHLKDAIKPGVPVHDPPPAWSIWKRRFREIGKGEIDWSLVAVTMKKVGYEGWVTVELDQPETPVESDMISMAYINTNIKPLLK